MSILARFNAVPGEHHNVRVHPNTAPLLRASLEQHEQMLWAATFSIVEEPALTEGCFICGIAQRPLDWEPRIYTVSCRNCPYCSRRLNPDQFCDHGFAVWKRVETVDNSPVFKAKK